MQDHKKFTIAQLLALVIYGPVSLVKKNLRGLREKFKTQNPILSRSLWLRFSSDKTISYTGFKAVYTYIPNPLGNLPDIGKCEFETGGFQGKAHNLKKNVWSLCRLSK